VLVGGLGADTLVGGEGRDVFRYGTMGEIDRDHIRDFTPGDDKIDLSAVDANALVSRDQAFNLHEGPGGPGAGEFTQSYDAERGGSLLTFNDGAHTSTMFVDGSHYFTVDDFNL